MRTEEERSFQPRSSFSSVHSICRGGGGRAFRFSRLPFEEKINKSTRFLHKGRYEGGGGGEERSRESSTKATSIVNRLTTVRSGWLSADQLCSRLIKEQVRVKEERTLHDEIDRTNFLFRSLSLEKLSHSRICLHESKLCNIYGPLRSLLKKNPCTLTITVSQPVGVTQFGPRIDLIKKRKNEIGRGLKSCPGKTRRVTRKKKRERKR